MGPSSQKYQVWFLLQVSLRYAIRAMLYLEPVTSHASNMLLEDVLALPVSFGRVIFQETVISSGFCFRACATWLESLGVEWVHFRVRWVEWF